MLDAAAKGSFKLEFELHEAIGAADVDVAASGGRWLGLGGSAVVGGRAQGVEQAVVCAAQRPEMLGGDGVVVTVGMPVHCQPSKRTLDVGRANTRCQTEEFVCVAHFLAFAES